MRISRNVAVPIATHAALTTGVHGVEDAYLAKTSQEAQTLGDTEIPAAIARDTEVTSAVAAEATARGVAISAHSNFATGIHGVGASTICSETEAATIAAAAVVNAKLIPEFLQLIAATGTFDVTPENVFDGDTGTTSDAKNVGEYAEILFPAPLRLTQYRQYGDTANSGVGKWTIKYLNLAGNWVDWITGIDTQDAAAWTEWVSDSEVVALGLRLVCTTVDTELNKSLCRELEVKY